MRKRIALAVVALVAVLALVVALQPASFAVERSAAIQAPADLVFGHIQSLRAMDAWSPFAKMDPQMRISYGRPEAGVGARSSWEGPQMGSGSLTVTGVKPGREVEMQLEMRKPMAASNRILFTLTPNGDTTQVTWRMEGRNGFLSRAIGLVMNMDRMVGAEFEQGLAALKTLAEADAAHRAALAGGPAS